MRSLAEDGHDAGIGQNEVQPAELRRALCENRLQWIEVADVGLLGDDAPPGLLDQLDGLGEVLLGRHRVGDAVELLAEVDGDDVGALFGEPNRVERTWPRAAPVMKVIFN